MNRLQNTILNSGRGVKPYVHDGGGHERGHHLHHQHIVPVATAPLADIKYTVWCRDEVRKHSRWRDIIQWLCMIPKARLYFAFLLPHKTQARPVGHQRGRPRTGSGPTGGGQALPTGDTCRRLQTLPTSTIHPAISIGGKQVDSCHPAAPSNTPAGSINGRHRGGSPGSPSPLRSSPRFPAPPHPPPGPGRLVESQPPTFASRPRPEAPHSPHAL